MTPAEQTATFCSVLLEDLSEVTSGLFCTVWSSGPEDKVTRWLPVSDLGAVAEAVAEAQAIPGYNTYLGMGLSRERHGPHRRMRREDVFAITSVWAEIDIAGEAHSAENLPRDQAEARRVLTAIGLEPTILWNSGHGLQAAWVLDEPWVFGADGRDPITDRAHAADLLKDWRGSIAVHAHRLGRYKVDAVHDLSRVLRVPGTENRKVIEKQEDGVVVERRALPPVPCVLVEHHPQRRYTVEDLRAHLVDRSQLEAFRGMPDPGENGLGKDTDLTSVWNLARSYAPNYQPQWLLDVIDNHPAKAKFRDVWRNGNPNGDSETDASIARYIAMAGGEPLDAVEAIYCYRLRTGRKLEKVDPRSRTDYVHTTVGRAFASQKAADEEYERKRNAARDALAAQDAEAAARRNTPPVAQDAAIVDPPDGSVPKLADMALHHLEHTSEVVVPDGSRSPAPAAAPPAASTPPEPQDEPQDAPADEPEDIPADEPADEEFDPEAAAQTEIPGKPEDRPRDVVAVVAERDEREGRTDGTGPSLLPPPNPFGERTATQTRELDALSEMLLGAEGNQRIWRLLEQGRGAKSMRRLQLRLPDDFVWVNVVPKNYRPGYPFNTGWWPAATFDAVGGFIRVLRQDAKLITRAVAAQEFNARFADSLVRLWEPDEQAGDVATVAQAGIANYLITHAPTTEWSESASGGTPFVKWASRPRWDVEGRFEVVIRWTELCRYIRAQYAVGVTPQVSAEIMEYSHSMIASTREQQGQWYRVDQAFLTHEMWDLIMDAGRNAELRRGERRGMHIVDGGKEAR